MLRAVAAFVFFLGALSIITTASAYKIARPSSPTTVSVVNYNAGQIGVTVGGNDQYFHWTQGAGSNTLTLDMTQGPTVGTTYTFDPNSTYKAYNVFRVTNNTAASKSINITVSPSSNVTVLSGSINGGAATSPPWTVPGGQYVDVNLQVTVTTAGGSATFTVTAN